MNSQKTYKIPALRRTFKLGMLYDCNNEKLIPGISLWNRQQLNCNNKGKNYGKISVKFLREESFENKLQAMGVEGELKLSCLLDLVKVEGFAKYQNSNLSLEKSTKVGLKFTKLTRFDEFKILEHKNPANVDEFKKMKGISATHVVVGIEYGMQAFLIFERKIDTYEEISEVKGGLSAKVSALKKIDLNAEISAYKKTISENDRKNINVKLYCDVPYDKNITNYDEAIEFYEKLPMFLNGKDDKEPVPQYIYLMPLMNLPDTYYFPKSYKQTFSNIRLDYYINEIEDILNSLNRAKIYLKEAMNSKMTLTFQHLKDRLNAFLECIRKYRKNFILNCRNIIPIIRQDGNSDKLRNLLDAHRKGPFFKKVINKWIFEDSQERNVLEGYYSLLSNIKTKNNKMLIKNPHLVTDFGEFCKDLIIVNKNIICLELRIEYDSDEIIEIMKETLNLNFTPNSPETEMINNVDFSTFYENAWYNIKDDNWIKINHMVHEFINFHAKNSDKFEVITLVIKPEQSIYENTIGASIYHFKEGELIEKCLPKTMKTSRACVIL